ncbi:Gfo/Idh/MocA family protein [Hahella ganghwensis]|uniref:Gfo/Idh/MocA family protein n=1 Tax=Hahella ganghwensis TaxID=286420 RepID=UPI00036F097D|nr:Gfo/Idh/MocA family oxidoreductase [Hahella ganghwensis]
MSDIKVAVVGVGWVARNVWIPLLQRARFSIRSLIDPQTLSLEAGLQQCPTASCHSSLSEAALQGADVVLVCSPNVMHVEQTVFALDLGFDVILEKPACFSRQDGQQIVDAAERGGGRFWVSSASTEREDVRYIHRLISQKEITDIKCIELHWRRAQGIPKAGSWFTNKSQAIGGCGAELGWHLLDVGLGFVDYPEVIGGHSSFFYPQPEKMVASADWYGGTNSIQGGSKNITVESQLYSSLHSRDHQIRLSTAWTSQQLTDTTGINVYSADGEISLRCTFGFSPHGLKSSYLKILRQGREERLQICHEEKITPYLRFVERVRREIVDRSMTNALECRRLLSLSSAMENIYGVSKAEEVNG